MYKTPILIILSLLHSAGNCKGSCS